jgi:DNA-binding CsgD family transcriptional regulator
MALSVKKSINNHIDRVISSMYNSMGNFYIKDQNGHVLGSNHNQLSSLGYSCLSQVIGKTVLDTPWKNFGHQIITNDQVVLEQEKPMQFIEYMGSWDNKVALFVSHKQPFYHDNELIGTCGTSLTIPLEQLQNNTPFSNRTAFIDIKKEQFIAVKNHQRRSLHLLLQGWSAKEIAKELGQSPRTIEHHLEYIKQKNGYHSIKDMLLFARVI